MLELFNLDELLDPNYNVTGRPCGKGPQMEPLDPDRISEIKDICLSYFESTRPEVLSVEWRNNPDAMSKKLSQLRLDEEQRQTMRNEVIKEM